jgi:hypothetical protein
MNLSREAIIGLSFVGLFFGIGGLLLGLTSPYPCGSVDIVGPFSGCPTPQSLAIRILIPLGIVIISIIGLALAFRMPKAIHSGTEVKTTL